MTRRLRAPTIRKMAEQTKHRQRTGSGVIAAASGWLSVASSEEGESPLAGPLDEPEPLDAGPASGEYVARCAVGWPPRARPGSPMYSLEMHVDLAHGLKPRTPTP